MGPHMNNFICAHPTKDQAPCQNPVAIGSSSCAAGHQIPSTRWAGWNQMVDTPSLEALTDLSPTVSADVLMADVTASRDEHADGEASRPVFSPTLAAELATTAHVGQVDKSGAPYIDHTSRIAAKMVEYYGEDADEVVVAWLHDVLEDTDLTVEDLRQKGCSEEQLDAIVALTHRPHEPNVDYLDRVKQNLIATRVKFGDIEDNTDPERMAKLDEETQARLQKKYAAAIDRLTR